MNWYCIYTKPRSEDAVARLLGKAGIETLSPKIRVLRRVRGKYADVIEQLFPSYLFARFEEDSQSHMITYTRGVKYIVGKESPLPVHSEIIEAIREGMRDGVVVPVPGDLKKGERVIVREGPFRDFYGIFQREMPGKARAMILLDALHCALDIETRSIRKV
jgi:transcriptional antiterminator RfaH